jgi:archaetidylinositol phosphate synthase
MANIESHTRVINTFTGPMERKVLRWFAAHMPARVTPDGLTSLGVLGAIVIAGSYGLTNINPAFLWLASLGFVINWFGDSMDGTLARYRQIERPRYGFYIDHVVDCYIEIMIFLGLGASPFVRFDLACMALIGYLLLSVLVFIRTCVRGEFTISYGKLGPTEVRLLAIFANTLVYFVGNPSLNLFSISLSVYDWLVIVVIILLFGISLATTYQQARQLAELDGWRLLRKRQRQQKRQRMQSTSGAMVERQD